MFKDFELTFKDSEPAFKGFEPPFKDFEHNFPCGLTNLVGQILKKRIVLNFGKHNPTDRELRHLLHYFLQKYHLGANTVQGAVKTLLDKDFITQDDGAYSYASNSWNSVLERKNK